MRVVTGLSYLSASAIWVLAGGAGALAADMPNYPTVTLPPPAVERPLERVEFSSGWYLRGDLGYRFQRTGESSSGDITQAPNPTSASLDNAFVIGFGAGLKRDWLRLDLTGDYGWRSAYNADYPGGSISGKVESFSVLANGYVDLGTWYGITPYVGAGIGAANLVFSGYQDSNPTGTLPATAVPSQRWNMAWAVMAGLSYTVARNLLIDVGYRHIDLGDISAGQNGQLTVKNLTGDEIRVGFRYLID